jgi:hypothetical protein
MNQIIILHFMCYLKDIAKKVKNSKMPKDGYAKYIRNFAFKWC